MVTPSGTDVSVLHVDDEPAFAETVAELLTREDERLLVETATSAAAGLQRLAETDVDCIVSDYEMPGRDGIEFLEAVRETHPDVPFILYTGKGSEEIASEAISAGVTDYMQKQGGTGQYAVLANKIVNAVTERRSRERAAAVSRIRDLRREVTQRLVRASDREEIESEVCRIVSRTDPYRLVWIGDEDGDAVRSRAAAGDATGYLDAVAIDTDGSGSPDEPTIRASRTQKLVTVGSITTDSAEESWQSAALDHGIAGVAAIPLVHDDRLYGTLTVYSDRPGVFDDRECDLLEELGADVAHAIHRAESERELRAQRADLRVYERAVESSQDLLAGVDTDLGYLFANERYRDFHGIDVEDLEDLTLPAVLGDAWSSEMREREQRVLDGEVVQYELDREGPDGGQRTFSVRDVPLRDEDGTILGVVGSMREVTERIERERELRRLKERLDLAVEVADIGVWDWNVRTDEVQFNEQWAAMLGSTLDEIDPHLDAWERRVHPEDLPAARDALEAHFAGETDYYECEHRMRTADGSWKWIRDIGRVTERDDAGDPVRAVGIHLDIDERKERERQLKESERRYRSLFEANPAVVWVEDFSAVVEHVASLRAEVEDVEAYLAENPDEIRTLLEKVAVIDVSDRALERYGAASKAALIENLEGLFTPEAYDANAEIWRRLADGETHFRVETVAKTFDGERRDEILDVRVPEGHGEDFSRVYLTAIDITERTDRERKLTALHDVATDLETAGTVESICERTVEASEEILAFDRSVVDIEEDGHLSKVAVSRELPDQSTTRMSIEDGIAGRTFRTGESVLIDDMNDWEQAEPQGPFRSGISVPIGDHGVFQAVAEAPGFFEESDLEMAELLISHTESALDRLEREGRLQRQNERLEEFASIVSHDLRNPLAVARNRTELLAQEHDLEGLDVVQQAHERMDTLVEDLLTLALDGNDRLEFDDVDLAALVADCWQTVETADATLSVETERTVRADRSQVQRLVENLVGNAIEHGGPDVTVRIGDLPDGFYVEDDGPGIPGDDRATVFEAGHSTAEEGTGYGLTIVERVASIHGWSVAVTESPDGGARFEITGVTGE